MYQSIHHDASRGPRQFASGPYRRPKYNVPLNVTETDDEFEAFVYAVGFSKENITVTVANDVMTILGLKQIDEHQTPAFRRQDTAAAENQRAFGPAEDLRCPLQQSWIRLREQALAIPGARRFVRAVLLVAHGFRGFDQNLSLKIQHPTRVPSRKDHSYSVQFAYQRCARQR